MDIYAHIVGWGMYAPETVITNDDLAKIVDTSDEWIRSRTGIRQRHIATEKETTASMAIIAAQEALDRARINPADVDMVIVATVSPEYPFPATACLVQEALGAKNSGAVDVNAGCSGFVYGLTLGAGMIKGGQSKVVVVIGAETLSRIVDWEDRSTCVLFGDGAGAVVLQASDEPGGVLATVLGSDGGGGKHLMVPGGGSKLPTSLDTVKNREHFIKMNGPEVYKFATRVMGRAAKEAVEKGGITLDDIDLFIPHQANARIIKSAAKYLKLDESKVFQNLQRYGNTSSASIPIALCEAIQNGRVRDGDNLVFVGFGAGLTWGATVVKWGLPVPYQQRQKWYKGLRWMLYRWARFTSKLYWFILGIENYLAHRKLPAIPYINPEKTPEKDITLPPSPPDANGASGKNGLNGKENASEIPEKTIEKK